MFGFNAPQIPEITPEKVMAAITAKENFVLLDVRTPGEYTRAKIAGSINVPVDEVADKVQTVIPDKNAIVYVYCLSGSRSIPAVQIMQQLGYTHVYNMPSGLLAWRAKGFSTV